MKYLILLVITITSIKLSAQITDTLYIGFTKSIYLVFNESPIHHANSEDVGVEEIIVKTLDNKLIITAAIENFEETNMFVQDGAKMYMFLLRYSNNPKRFLYNYQQNNTSQNKNKFNNDVVSNEATEATENTTLIDYQLKNEKTQEKEDKESIKSEFENNSILVLNLDQKIYSKGSKVGKMSIVATNLNVHNNYFYLKIKIFNSSDIKYDIDMFRFVIKNKSKSVKKSADQYIELEPKFTLNQNQTTVPPTDFTEYVFVFEKFTIQDNKKLNIQVLEKNGDRILEFDFYSKDILNLKSIY